MDNHYDIGIVGAGPAGLSAAFTVRWRNRSVFLADGRPEMGSLQRAPHVSNYLGLPPMPGTKLRERFLAQVWDAGVTIHRLTVKGVYPENGSFALQAGDDLVYVGAVVLATGAPPRDLLPGEERLLGAGVSYCASCDGPLFKGKRVAAVLAGEDPHEVLYLAELAERVYLFTPPDNIHPPFPSNIEPIPESLQAVTGSEHVEGVQLASGKTLPVEGVFFFTGRLPMAQLVPGLDTAGDAVEVNLRMATAVPGVFAAGDITGHPYQVARSVGQGQVAALEALSYMGR